MVQKLKLHASKAGDRGSIPGWEAEIPHAAWPKKKKKVAYRRVRPKSTVSLRHSSPGF